VLSAVVGDWVAAGGTGTGAPQSQRRRPAGAWASFSSENWGEKHCIRIPVAFRLYLVKIIQILTN
jgi:hypothetical protein